MKTAFVNGRYLPFAAAQVHIEDRGYQFADGAYEVCAVFNRRILDLEPHLVRLDRSLSELRIANPFTRNGWSEILNNTVAANEVDTGIVYIQVSRGVAPRDHKFPNSIEPSVVVTSRPLDYERVFQNGRAGLKVVTTPEIRWKRCDIKSIALVASVLAKQRAVEANAAEAIFVRDDGVVTEGASTNVFIVDEDGTLRTHPSNNSILTGIVRMRALEFAAASSCQVKEEAFSLADACRAREVFITSTTLAVSGVVTIDNCEIGEGKVGPLTQRLIDRYEAHCIQGG